MISLWQGRPRTNIIECFFLLQSVLLASPQLFSFHPPFSQHPLGRASMDQLQSAFKQSRTADTPSSPVHFNLSEMAVTFSFAVVSSSYYLKPVWFGLASLKNVNDSNAHQLYQNLSFLIVYLFVGPLPGPTMKCVCLVHHPPTTTTHPRHLAQRSNSALLTVPRPQTHTFSESS